MDIKSTKNIILLLYLYKTTKYLFISLVLTTTLKYTKKLHLFPATYTAAIVSKDKLKEGKETNTFVHRCDDQFVRKTEVIKNLKDSCPHFLYHRTH